ncbi:DNA polymerase IV [Bacillus chungangensis]|uniref:DNA polymerase IV n=1 Tax=Bacillus chungangensis TaxID=587633 RepID=A0ABT9WP79_9BACI|nr:DNA polymerase IV [Bacillus chungangensis]MDQ0175088.1 DNA polymerase-4 [Bacillus chungangensis]
MKQFYPKNGRVILHVDMNSFFASVEIAYDPTLKGKPLAIARTEEKRRGVIVTCSYEARAYGVKTTMNVWEAKKLCPHLIVRPPHMDRYRLASKEMFELLNGYSNLVEPVSIDEGYIDITDSHELGSPLDIAKDLQKSILNKLHLPCSIGIAPNKFLAKMASNMKKPLGITILRKRDVQTKLWPLPIIQMHGIGQKTAAKLKAIHLYTIGDIAKANELQLKQLLGIRGLKMKERANGIDDRPVDPETANEHKSIGHSTTLAKDVSSEKELIKVLNQLSAQTASRLKKKGYAANNIVVTIRYHDRKTITRSRKLPYPIIRTTDVFEAAKNLFLEHWDGNPVRLLGVTGQDLMAEEEGFEQLNLFSFHKAAEKETLYKTIEKLQSKFGKTAIQQGAKFSKQQFDQGKGKPPI